MEQVQATLPSYLKKSQKSVFTVTLNHDGKNYNLSIISKDSKIQKNYSGSKNGVVAFLCAIKDGAGEKKAITIARHYGELEKTN